MELQDAGAFQVTQDISLGENGEFTLALSAKKLNDITNTKMRALKFDVPEAAYEELSEGDKRALVHLIKAATILDTIFLKQDHHDNIRAKKAFENAAKGDVTIQQAYTLFKSFNGLEGMDMYAKKSRPLRIFKDKKIPVGKGFYPEGMTKEKLIKYLLAHPEQASAILSNNTMVVSENGRLNAVPYSVVFRDEMEGAARELMLAAKETEHKDFATYLKWQAQALVNDSDPEMLFNADKAWISLEDSPLEFTIARESYDDQLSSEVAADVRIKEMLSENNIIAKSKDTIGIRVGIADQDSYASIDLYRKHLDSFGALMPLYEKYSNGNSTEGSKMTFADVHLVAFKGDYAAVRGGVTVAQNLPNSDKLAVQLGVGSRMVFHRQVRNSGDPQQQRRMLDALIDSSQHELYDKNADFEFVVGHELVHSLGPRATADGRDKKGSLGKWGAVLEENKADLGSIVMTGYLVDCGEYDQVKANKIYLTWIVKSLPLKQPNEDEAHRYRSIMQLNYFLEKGAVELAVGGKLRIHPELMAGTARQMLEEVIQLQLDGNAEKAEVFAKQYGAWNDVMKYVTEQQMKLKPKLYRVIEQPMADRLLAGPSI